MRLLPLAQAGDESAREELIRENLPLVHALARRFFARAPHEDLVQAGSIGLLNAIAKFDVGFQVQFSTYAVPLILGEMKQLLRVGGSVKVSRTIQRNHVRVKECIEQLRQVTGDEPTLAAVAHELQLSVQDVALALESSRMVLSLDVPIEEGGVRVPVVQEDITERLFLKEMLGTLPDQERQLILLRYAREQTQSQTARVLGMTQVQVSRLERKILKRLREAALG